MLKHPLDHEQDLKAVAALARRRWVTCGDIETLLGIPRHRAKFLANYLAEHGVVQKWRHEHGNRCFGPIGDA